jgi:hypothetical protein
LIETGRERSARSALAHADGESGESVALGEALERGQPKRRLHRSASFRGEIVLAQGSDELVDFAERLACDLFDRREGGLRALRVVRAEQPGRAGMDEDHVDCVASRIVEVARDACALLGGGEAALAFGVPLRLLGALLELGDPLAPQTDAVADNPRATPDESAREERHGGKLILGYADGAGVGDEEEGNNDACQPSRCARLVRVQGKEVEGDGRAERGPGRVTEAV